MRTKKKEKRILDDSIIDYSDIPPLTDEQLRSMKRMGRPLLGTAPRHLIAVRLDPEVLTKLRIEAKKKGKGYQTLINEILNKYVSRKKAA